MNLPMKKYILIAGVFMASVAIGQTKTTNALEKQFEDSFVLFFYNNTLKMLNQTEDKEFDELIKDIEKMKFLMINKSAANFSNADYKALVTGYKSEKYENMMSARSEGKNFDVYLMEENDRVKGTVILVNDSAQLYVLDVVGRVNPNQVTKFFSSLDENSDIAGKIKGFMGDADNSKKKGSKEKGIKID
jgi:CRISPR/Cas system-associated endonuclease/helicase Cas3